MTLLYLSLIKKINFFLDEGQHWVCEQRAVQQAGTPLLQQAALPLSQKVLLPRYSRTTVCCTVVRHSISPTGSTTTQPESTSPQVGLQCAVQCTLVLGGPRSALPIKRIKYPNIIKSNVKVDFAFLCKQTANERQHAFSCIKKSYKSFLLQRKH